MTGQTATNRAGHNPAMQTLADAFVVHYSAAESQQLSAWPQSFREQGFSSLARTGFPERRDEDWKYTSLDEFIQRSARYLGNGPAKKASAAAVNFLPHLPCVENEIRIVFVNGIYHAALSAGPDSPGKLTIVPFSSADADNLPHEPNGLVDRNSLIAFNSAFLADGLRITVADRVIADRPVHVVFITDGEPSASQARLQIQVGENASARVIQHHIGAGEGLTNVVTEIDCAQHAQLSFLKLQNESKAAFHVCNLFARLADHADLNFIGLDFGSQLARTDLDIEIAGQHANVGLHGLFMANDQRHVDNHLSIHHKQKNTRSVENFRGIMNDAARGVFNGKIIVHSGADGADAQMSNHNLLLGDKAEIDTKPELEIYTDDVKCAHGSTTGRLDMNALFYLRARGIPARTAKSMLIAAFAEEITQQVRNVFPALEEHLHNIITEQLPEQL